jgi:glycerate kinase
VTTPSGALRRRTVLIAPDSFKGSLTSVAVARALADGWARARPDDTVLLCPLADGGEGTLEAIAAAGGWEWRETEILGIDFAPTAARWLRSDDGTRAAVELAQGSGLSMLRSGDYAPTLRTSHGTGQLIQAALVAGVRHITLGIGGSATNDGGAGLLQVLGARPLDETGSTRVEEPTPTPPILLIDIARVDLERLDRRLATVKMEVACDVSNPLLGPTGATAIYGPQKGVTAEDEAILEEALLDWANALEAATGRNERDTPGAGAAGGVGFALLAIQDAFAGFALRPGVDLVMEATDFDERLARADLVVTGEGRIDAQTAFGKTALGVARRAAAAGVPCLAVGGGVEPAGIDALAAVGAVAVPVVERPMSVEEAMASGTDPLERCGERLAQIVSLGFRT